MGQVRVLKSFELAEDGRGRRAYVAWLEARAANDGGGVNERAQAALRRGRYLGEEGFRDRLLALVDKAQGVKPRQRRKVERLEKNYGEADVERLILEYGSKLGLSVSVGEAELKNLRKGDERKAILAELLRRRTAVSAEWIDKPLHMGNPGSVSRQVGIVKRIAKRKNKSMN